jgi:spore cortex biosynthesis protein YabQ
VEYVTVQLSSFITLLLTGMVMGGFFDLYRVWRGTIKVNWLITAVGDLFFWFIALLVAIPLIFWSTWLELRFYVWLAIGGGLLLYFGMFSRVWLPVLLRLRYGLAWLPRQLGRLKQYIQLVWHKSRMGRSKREKL